jgi:hypothetical protein
MKRNRLRQVRVFFKWGFGAHRAIRVAEISSFWVNRAKAGQGKLDHAIH